MNKKAQILMIGMWILVVMTILAVSIGHRVSIALRLSRYQRDSLKALYLAKAGVNQGIAELAKEPMSAYDALSQIWSTGLDAEKNALFTSVKIDDNPRETFSVSYYDKDSGSYLCMEDQERKIYINKLDSGNDKVITKLFESVEIQETEALKLTEILKEWISETSEAEEGKKVFKNALLKTTQELTGVLEYYYKNIKNDDSYQKSAGELYNEIKDLITVYGDGKVNINTVSKDMLLILVKAYGVDEKDAQALVDTIIQSRQGDDKVSGTEDDTPFTSAIILGKFIDDLTVISDVTTKTKIKDSFVVASSCFKIESLGTAGGVTKKITAIYDRGNRKITFWHQN